MTVTDTATGASRRYLNPSGQLASVGDTTAFGPQGALAVADPAGTLLTQAMAVPTGGTLPAGGGQAGPGAASPDGRCHSAASTLCLDGGRFSVHVSWQDFSGRQGVGTAVDLSAQTGYFWFFNAVDVDLMLKVIDGRAINGKFWVLFGALSKVAYTVTVQDTVSGKLRPTPTPPAILPAWRTPPPSDTSTIPGRAATQGPTASILRSLSDPRDQRQLELRGLHF